MHIHIYIYQQVSDNVPYLRIVTSVSPRKQDVLIAQWQCHENKHIYLWELPVLTYLILAAPWAPSYFYNESGQKRKENKMKCYVFHQRVLPAVSMSWNNCAGLWERTGEKHRDKINCSEYPVVNHHSLRSFPSSSPGAIPSDQCSTPHV